jgi:hypothetical protein
VQLLVHFGDPALGLVQTVVQVQRHFADQVVFEDLALAGVEQPLPGRNFVGQRVARADESILGRRNTRA